MTHADSEVVQRPSDSELPSAADEEENCDYCGARALVWRTCKLMCTNCCNIVKSCADL